MDSQWAKEFGPQVLNLVTMVFSSSDTIHLLPKHKGDILVDMKSKGIEVKPIQQITGGSVSMRCNFNDVKEIPDSHRLGKLVTVGKWLIWP